MGTGNGQFSYPEGVAVAPRRPGIYVADTENHRVQEVKFDGTLAFTRKWGRNGGDAGRPALALVSSTSPAGWRWATTAGFSY
ncbi:MAG: hypothetical protein U0075_14355 [Thermomicrobiales bacterium]